MKRVSNRKTPSEIENRILTLMALGEKYSDISIKTGVAVSTIKKIKRRNNNQLTKVEQQVVAWRVVEVKSILRQSYSLIQQKLDDAEVGRIDIPLRDLLAVNKVMFNQTQSDRDNLETPNPEATQRLLELASKL